MSNPIFSALGKKPVSSIDPQIIASTKRMVGLLNAAKDPMAALNKAAGQNPTLAAALKLCNGRDPKEVFYELCDKNGINPDDILNQLK